MTDHSYAACAKLTGVKTVAEKIRAAGDLLLQALREPGLNINERLNATLNEFLTWPLRADSACIVDSEGRKATFETLIYSGSGENSEPGMRVMPMPRLALSMRSTTWQPGKYAAAMKALPPLNGSKEPVRRKRDLSTPHLWGSSSPSTQAYPSKTSRNLLFERTRIVRPQNGPT
jgi:hypothetical protein